jgi:GDP-L-fucose synthase
MDRKAKIYVAGHTGMAGEALLRLLKKQGYQNLILKPHRELDLRQQDKVERFMQKERPDYVFLFAAKVGGIEANINYPAQFLYDNIMIEANVIEASYRSKVRKLLFLASSCIYPRSSLQPMKEEYLLSGRLEPTNEGYALAKILGLKLCEYYNREFRTNYICLIPTNIYGVNDNFDLHSSHVLPALIRKFHVAKLKKESSVTVWGTGEARREFLYADDLADACLYFMNNYEKSHVVNLGVGEDISIKELACLIKDIIGYQGKIVFDSSRPSGMPQKLLDISRLNRIDWKPGMSLPDGIKKAYEWFCQE